MSGWTVLGSWRKNVLSGKAMDQQIKLKRSFGQRLGEKTRWKYPNILWGKKQLKRENPYSAGTATLSLTHPQLGFPPASSRRGTYIIICGVLDLKSFPVVIKGFYYIKQIGASQLITLSGSKLLGVAHSPRYLSCSLLPDLIVRREASTIYFHGHEVLPPQTPRNEAKGPWAKPFKLVS